MSIASDKKASDWTKHIASADKATQEGKYDFAEATWMLALEEAEDFGENDRRLAFTLEKLSECLWFLNRLDEALYYGNRSLKIYERVLGPQHHDVGSIAGNIARIHHLQGNFAEAEQLYKRALGIKTASLGQQNPEVQQLLSSFADCLQSMGRQEEAAQLRTSASMPTKKQWRKTGSHRAHQKGGKPVSESTLSSPSTPRPPQSTDEFLPKKGMNFQDFKAEAERALQKGDLLEAERIWIMSLPVARGENENNPDHCYALESIAELSLRLEKFKDAERCFQKSYDIKVKVLGKSHSAVAHSASSLAKLYYSMCDYSRAEKMGRLAVEVFESADGKESKDLACALHNLATLFHVQRKYDHAEEYYQRAMTMKQKLFGGDHPETLSVLKNYANLLKSTHREEQAKHLDSCADGMVTGSWKVLDVQQQDRLSGGWEQVLLSED
jgi:tetratricopeptide (TPR) repeat protein